MPAPQDDVIERTLPPHKSWRELPPTPPLGVPLPPPEATQTFAATELSPGSRAREDQARSPGARCLCRCRRRRGCGRRCLRGRDPRRPERRERPSPVAGASAPNDPESVQSVVKQVAPAVVEIQHDGGVGSGVIYDKSGLILTAHHVVAGADNVTVKTADGQTLDGTVVGRDAEHDLAIVAVKAPKRPSDGRSRGARTASRSVRARSRWEARSASRRRSPPASSAGSTAASRSATRRSPV